jgi:hypothetical protein
VHRFTRFAALALALAAGHAGVSAAHPAAARSCGMIHDDGDPVGITVQRGPVASSHATAAELGWVALRDALAILLVINATDEARFDQTAARWAGRLALEVRDLSLKQLAGALESLVALPDGNAQRSLLALTERAVRPRGAVREAPAALRGSQQGRRRGFLS